MVNDMIKRFCIPAIALMGIALFISFTPPPQGKGQPTIPKLSQFRGDIFKNFAEFRVQNSSFGQTGLLTLEDEPYNVLINCNTIIKVHRFEDGKATDYSCLMFIREHTHPNRKVKPTLIRETYKEVLRKIKRAIESR